MASTTFVAGTVIPVNWLNEVNALLWGSSSPPATPIRVDSSGNVAVNGATAGKFTVYTVSATGGGANQGVNIANAGNTRQLNFGVNDSNSTTWIQGWVPGSGGSNLVLQPSTGDVGVGLSPSANYRVDVNGTIRSIGGETTSGYGIRVLNSTQNGGGHLTANAGLNGGITIGGDSGPVSLSAGGIIGFRVSSAGDGILKLNTSAPTLTTNTEMVFTLTSNTNLRISVRGTDGTTRTANITLA